MKFMVCWNCHPSQHRSFTEEVSLYRLCGCTSEGSKNKRIDVCVTRHLFMIGIWALSGVCMFMCSCLPQHHTLPPILIAATIRKPHLIYPIQLSPQINFATNNPPPSPLTHLRFHYLSCLIRGSSLAYKRVQIHSQLYLLSPQPHTNYL